MSDRTDGLMDGRVESATLDGMTLERQIGQLFAVGFAGTTPTLELLDLIQRDHVGAVILFSRNIRDREQTAALTHDVQEAARAAGHPYPLLIMTDQEYGLVRRLGVDSTVFPGNMALGAIDAEQGERMAYEVARATARELLAHGIDMNLAPVVDVNNNPANPVIGIRSYGERAERVARLGAAAVRGYQDAGVIATLKHFPGHGDTTVDSHRALPVIGADLARLEALELPPFRAGIAAGAEAVLIAHVALPSLVLPGLVAGDANPATLSRPIVTGLLRERLGFDGLVVSDCLEMDAIARGVGTSAGAVAALRAGVDLVLVSHRLDRQRASIAAVRSAVASGELEASRVRAAARRVTWVKRRHLAWRSVAPAALDEGIPVAHRALRDRAYAQSVTVLRDEADLLPLRLAPGDGLLVIGCPGRAASRAVDVPYADAVLVEALRQHYERVGALTLRPNATEDELWVAVQAARRAAAVVLVTLNLHLDERQQRAIQRTLTKARRVIGLAACDPYDADALPDVRTWLATYGYSPPAMEAAAGVLVGAIQPRGRSPVSLGTRAVETPEA